MTDLSGNEPVDINGNPEYYSVDYSKLSVILLQGLKETINKLEITENKLEITENKLEIMEKKLDDLMNQITNLNILFNKN
jgi:hypothetical protein